MKIHSCFAIFLSLFAATVLTGCAGKRDSAPAGGALADAFMSTPNAIPKVETFHKASLKPYTVDGKRYTPLTGDVAYNETGIGSWYGKKFHGRKTSNGETYNMYAMTAAHKTLPLPSYVRVTNLNTGQSIIVRVNDRGPFIEDRIIDLSYAAAARLGYANKGTARVRVERIRNADIKAGRIPSTFSRRTIDSDDKSKLADALAIASVIAQSTDKGITEVHQIQDVISVISKASNIVNTTKEKASAITVTEEPAQTNSVVITNGEYPTTARTLTEAETVHVVELTPTKPAAETSVVLSTTDDWVLQAGAFSSMDNALAFARQIETAASVTTNVRQFGHLYKVFIGPYPSSNAAKEAAQTLEITLGKKLVPIQRPTL